jgi:DNA-binding winged helix-turn-helix (wHTH) protein/tetratricopeptide (TPR) repeat protein
MLPQARLFRFGEFCFDPMRRVLLRGSSVTPVAERLALILTQLLQAGGRVVSKETLAVTVWPNDAVSDGNLVQHIYLLRRLFGETAKDRSHVLSVPRTGYRFAVPVEVVESSLNETFTTDAASLGAIVSGAQFEPFRTYCQGSYFLEQRTAPAIRRAAVFFQSSLQASSDYVPSLIGLARAHQYLGTYWHLPPNLAFPPALEAVEKALAIDPASAVAHAVRSGLLCFWKWDWDGARRESKLAITLNPGSTFVRTNAAWVHVCAGRLERALLEAQLALTLEPSSLSLQLLVARVLLHSGKNTEAIALMSNILETSPAFYIARRYRAQAYLLDAQPEKAIGDLELLPQEPSEDPSFRLPMLGRAYADAGESRRAVEVFDALRGLARTQYVVCWNLAIVASGLRRYADALSYLETACEQHEATLPFLGSLPWFEAISGDARFKQIVQRVEAGSTHQES